MSVIITLSQYKEALAKAPKNEEYEHEWEQVNRAEAEGKKFVSFIVEGNEEDRRYFRAFFDDLNQAEDHMKSLGMKNEAI